MLDLIQKLFSSQKSTRKSGSKQIAKERLQFVLVQDKISISPQNLERIKDDLLEVLSKYVEIDRSAMEISLSKVDSSIALVANIPVSNKKIRQDKR